MNAKPKPPSLLRIAIADWLSTLLGVFALLALVMFLVFSWVMPPAERRPNDWQFINALAIGAVVFVLAFVLRLATRVATVRWRWTRGVFTHAHIIDVQSAVGMAFRRAVKLRYHVGGKTYDVIKYVGIRWVPFTRSLAVIVDPQSPDKPLYLDDYQG